MCIWSNSISVSFKKNSLTELYSRFPSSFLHSPTLPPSFSFLLSYPCQDDVKKCDNWLCLQWLVWTRYFCKIYIYFFSERCRFPIPPSHHLPSTPFYPCILLLISLTFSTFLTSFTFHLSPYFKVYFSFSTDLKYFMNVCMHMILLKPIFVKIPWFE